MKAVEAERTDIAELLLTQKVGINIRNEMEPVRTALKLECCLFYRPSAVEAFNVVW